MSSDWIGSPMAPFGAVNGGIQSAITPKVGGAEIYDPLAPWAPVAVPVNGIFAAAEQSPWLSNIDGGFHTLSNVNLDNVTVDGRPLSGALVLRGSVPNSGSFPSNPQIGDTYITKDNGHLWTWDGQTWVDLGPGTGGMQTPWLSNIDAAGFPLLNAGGISTTSLLIVNKDPYYTQLQMNSDRLNWIFSLSGSGTGLPGSLSLLRDTEVTMIFSPYGYVGIGTSNPAAQLEIFRAQQDNNPILIVSNVWGRIEFGGDWNGKFINSPSSPLLFKTVNDQRMVIDTQGRVGIGTQNPQGTLDVNGDVFVYGNNLWMQRQDGSPANLVVKSDSETWVLRNSGSASQLPGYFSIVQNSTGEYVFTISTSGSVGIGINQPNANYKLNVAGDINLTGRILINGVQVLP